MAAQKFHAVFWSINLILFCFRKEKKKNTSCSLSHITINTFYRTLNHYCKRKKRRGNNITLNFIVGEIPVRLSSLHKWGKGRDVML